MGRKGVEVITLYCRAKTAGVQEMLQYFKVGLKTTNDLVNAQQLVQLIEQLGEV